MTLAQIRERVRDNFHDYNDFVLSDSQITNRINDGYDEFCKQTRCLVKHSSVTITADTALFSVPTDNLSINRAEWKGREIDIVTTREMDYGYHLPYTGESVAVDWRNATGTDIVAIIQDFEGFNYIRIYPQIDDADDIGGLVLGTDSNTYKCISAHTASSSNKPITGASYATYWEATTSDGTGDTWVTGTSYKKYYNLELDHSYMPDALSDDDDEPAIPSRYHKALEWYATAECKMLENGVDKDMVEENIFRRKFYQYVNECKGEVMRGFNSYRPRRIKTRPFI